MQRLLQHPQTARSSDIPRVVAHLQQHADEPLQQARGCAVLDFVSETNPTALVRGGGLPVLVAAAQRHASHPDLQRDCCGVLANLAGGDAECKLAVVDAGGVQIIAAAMQTHSGIVSVQSAGCLCLHRLTTGGAECLHGILHSRAVVIPVTVDAMRQYPAERDIQESSCGILVSVLSANSTHSQEDARAVFEGGAVAAIVAALRMYPPFFCGVDCLAWLAHHNEGCKSAVVRAKGVDPIVESLSTRIQQSPQMGMKNHLSLLRNISAGGSRCKKAIVEAGGLPVLVNFARFHPGAPRMYDCFRVLSYIASGDAVCKKALVDAEGISVLSNALARNSSEQQGERSCCTALSHLAAGDDICKAAVLRSGGPKTVVSVASRPSAPHDTIVTCCTMLFNLSGLWPEWPFATSSTLWTTTMGSECLTFVVGAAQALQNDLRVQACLARVFPIFAAGDEEAKRAVIDSGALALMVEEIRAKSARSTTWLNCLGTVAAGNEACKLAVVESGGVELLVAALASASGSGLEEKKLCMALDCIASGNERCKKQVVHNGGVAVLVAAMEHSAEDVDTQQTACSALHHIAEGDTVCRQAVVDSRCGSVVAAAMQQHVDAMQLQGCARSLLRQIGFGGLCTLGAMQSLVLNPFSAAQSSSRFVTADSVSNAARVTEGQQLSVEVSPRDVLGAEIDSVDVRLAIASCLVLRVDAGPAPANTVFSCSSEHGAIRCQVSLSAPGDHKLEVVLSGARAEPIGEPLSVHVEAAEPHCVGWSGKNHEHVIMDGEVWSGQVQVEDQSGRPFVLSLAQVLDVCFRKSDSEAAHLELTVDEVEMVGSDVVGGKRKQNPSGSEIALALVQPIGEDVRGELDLWLQLQFGGGDKWFKCEGVTIRAVRNKDPRKWTAADVVQFLQDDEGLNFDESKFKDRQGRAIDGAKLCQEGQQRLLSWMDDDESDDSVCGRVDSAIQRLKEMAQDVDFQSSLESVTSNCSITITESEIRLDEEKLGEGGTGVVHAGVWRDRRVAVKTPRAAVERKTVEALQKELKKLMRCQHDNVVQCHGMMVGRKRIGIVMELCERLSLCKCVESGWLNGWPVRLRAALDAARGLTYLHCQCMAVHRDIKPANLLVTAAGCVKVADFGLAKLDEVLATKSTTIHGPAGTAVWMAPEAWEAKWGFPADVWSFGAVLCFLITKKEPFPDLQGNTLAIMQTVCNNKGVPKPHRKHLPPTCPPALRALQAACCQYEQGARPRMQSVQQQLEAMLEAVPDPDDFALPRHWRALGLDLASPSKLVALAPSDEYYQRCQARLLAVMPDAKVSSVSVNCNVGLYKQFFYYRQFVARSNGWAGADAMELAARTNERWLWHGNSLAKLSKILHTGFRVQHSNLDFAYYGAGIYFAPDARLSHHFAARAEAGAERALVLARVACGRVGKKKSLLDAEVAGTQRRLNLSAGSATRKQDAERVRQLLRRAEHRNPPEGFQAVLGVDDHRESDTELVRRCLRAPLGLLGPWITLLRRLQMCGVRREGLPAHWFPGRVRQLAGVSSLPRQVHAAQRAPDPVSARAVPQDPGRCAASQRSSVKPSTLCSYCIPVICTCRILKRSRCRGAAA